MKKFLKKVLPVHVANRLRHLKFVWINDYSTPSYSQEGEDMILRKVLADRENGFFVDVGAHHPKRFSNTYFFYRLGWSGINIDAAPGSMRLFQQQRPRDINLEVGIAREPKEMTFFVFNEPALNSFDKALAQSRESEHLHILGEQKVGTRTLADVLNEHVPANQRIDFLTVDVEGLDLEVLQSNDWHRFRPWYVLAECFGVRLTQVHESPIGQFLFEQGYEVFAKTDHTFFFVDSSHQG